ncbi:hypothetical protein SBRCBS47491_009517 [Sporothrix bragantina]|uniref:Uncharacterized protein n=1 Tax=Sporothrix bragantina TaxID=671064 RepID=A0ABP0CYU2_9PEZI
MAQNIPPGRPTPPAAQAQAPARSPALPQLRGPSQPAPSPQQTPQPAAQPAPQQAPPQRIQSQPPAPQQRMPSQPPQQPDLQQQLQQQRPSPHMQQHPPSQHFQNEHPHPPHLQQPIPQRGVGRPPDPVMVHRAPIVNPPPQGIPQPLPQRKEPAVVDPRGGIQHPSPGRLYHQENRKVWDDYMRLTFAIEQCLSDSVRCAVRQNWQKCLLGTTFHQGFMLNALLDTVPADVARGSIKDFGMKLVKNAKAEIVAHMSSADIDEVTNQILAQASDRFLDAALEMRLRTIDAKPLINALARAERLGYEPGDIVEEPLGGQERVIPQDMPQGVQQPPPPPSAATPFRRQCQMCSRLFSEEPPYVYHFANNGFENTYGLQYHNSTHACRKYNSPKATPVAAAAVPPAQQKPIAASQTSRPSSQKATLAEQPAVMPTPPRPPQPGSAHKSPASDAYAHLSEEKLAALNNELLKCEEIFAERFREVDDIVDPSQRRMKLDNLKNSFGTRQSIIRKKYGVRLRERRTKAELISERERMGLSGHNSLYSSPVKRASGDLYPTSTTPTSSQGDGTAPYAVKRARADGATPAGSRSASVSRGTPEVIERKRDTIAPSATISMTETPRAERLPPPPAEDDDDNMSDSSSDNDDIPARLPDSVRQSLTSSQR